MKKFLSLVLALVMTMSLVTVSAGAKDFTDDSEITYKEAVDVISALGVVDGYSGGDFRPDDVLTRGAAAKIICNLILGPTTASALSAGTAPFKDVPVTNTFAGYITYCSQQGIISGYADGTFRPTGTLSGNAFMKMLLGALGYDADVEGFTGANWSVNVAKQAIGIGLIFVCVCFRSHMPAKVVGIVLFILLAGLDYMTFHRLFLQSRQEDQIADAIEKIAGGDTSYQMNLAGLEGKELKVGNMINSIGTGLERALQEQVKSERLKADLITNVSHDIKTPLTSIINYVDLLKREQIPGERAQEYLKVLDQKSQRLKNLTEDLVEASKASSGNVKLEMTTLDIVEMIWQTNGEFEEKFATRSLELVSTLPESSILIEADGRHLWRVLENVYNNAFKYAMEHTRVYTDLELKDDKVYFTIKNISANPLNVQGEELTERFVRGDVSRTTEGSGLGLSIAQSLTKLQGGTFEILIDGDLFKVRVGFGIKKTD